jgi:peptide/nickel transport system substrate-binding protein
MNQMFIGSIAAPFLLGAALFIAAPAAVGPQSASRPEHLVTAAETGRSGGQLVIAQRAEPRTLNPVVAVDTPSRDVIRRLHADLIHINPETQRTEPALAKSWTKSPDGLRFTLALRQGVQFSDGHPFDADDVVFSFRVYLDEKIASPLRDQLIVNGKPLGVVKLNQHSVQFDFPGPYAVAERVFDNLAILPQHLLEKAYQEGRLAEAWSLGTPPAQFAGLGPFRLKELVPGERVVLERNPFYWKVDRAGTRLPYLDSLVFPIVPNADAQAVRFQSGESDVTTRLSAATHDVLARNAAKAGYDLFDLGAGLDFTFLFFNLNDLAPDASADTVRKRGWFRQLAFRQAVSAAIDRDAIVRLVYRGRATPLWGHVPPGNSTWVNRSISKPPRSLERARQVLQQAGFKNNADGALLDGAGQPIDFTLVTNSENAERVQIATIIQEDLKQLGMQVRVVTLELRALTSRLLTSFDYEAAILGLGGGDADPNAQMNVWLSSGGFHLWHMGQRKPATTWEAELDTLMQRQLTTLDAQERKRQYDRVQALVAEHLPIISLVSPNVLVGAKKGLGNFRPTVLDHHALWNVEELFWRERRSGASQ